MARAHTVSKYFDDQAGGAGRGADPGGESDGESDSCCSFVVPDSASISREGSETETDVPVVVETPKRRSPFSDEVYGRSGPRLRKRHVRRRYRGSCPPDPSPCAGRGRALRTKVLPDMADSEVCRCRRAVSVSRLLCSVAELEAAFDMVRADVALLHSVFGGAPPPVREALRQLADDVGLLDGETRGAGRSTRLGGCCRVAAPGGSRGRSRQPYGYIPKGCHSCSVLEGGRWRGPLGADSDKENEDPEPEAFVTRSRARESVNIRRVSESPEA